MNNIADIDGIAMQMAQELETHMGKDKMIIPLLDYIRDQLQRVASQARAEQRGVDASIAENYPHNSGGLRNIIRSLADSIAAAIRNQKESTG